VTEVTKPRQRKPKVTNNEKVEQNCSKDSNNSQHQASKTPKRGGGRKSNSTTTTVFKPIDGIVIDNDKNLNETNIQK
jgi:hypothetical protein